MNGKIFLILTLGLMILAGTSQAVMVNGHCYLQGQTNHVGTRVLFAAVSPGAVTDSAFTDTAGFYQKDITLGVYDVHFRHDGFAHQVIANQLFTQPTTLPDVTLLALLPGIHISGNLSGVLQDTVYYVDDNILVPINHELSIRPGATLYFMGEDDQRFYLLIQGNLRSEGTLTDSIKFLPGPGATPWSGITFYDWADSSSMAYCLVGGVQGLSIYCNGSGTEIEHCSIVSDSPSTDGIKCNDNTNTIISYCTVSVTGVGIISDYSDPTISHCLITSVSNNGIYAEISSPEITNCTIFGAYDGVYLDNSPMTDTLKMVNTIVNSCGDYGVYFDDLYNGHVNITYCDLSDNAHGNFSSPVQYLGQIVTVNTNGDSCDAYYNIFSDPLFVDAPGGDFHLQAGSRCIDAGDPNSPHDRDGTVADIGAFYFDQGPPIPHPQIVLSTNSLNFGSTVQGTQATLWFLIYNHGNANLRVHSITSSSPAFSTNFPPQGVTYAPGDSGLVSVFFTPQQITTYTGTLTIHNNDEPVTVALQGQGIGPVDITMTPVNPPIVIPVQGGSYNFSAGIHNLTGTIQTIDLWMQIHLPGTGMVETLNLSNLLLPANINISRTRTQQVPASAPAGVYIHFGYVGDHPWVIADFDSFAFTKSGTNTEGTLGSSADWLCSGESFNQIPAETLIPTDYSMSLPIPNPFNLSTILRFQLPASSRVSLKVLDITGRLVTTLVNGWREAGTHEVTFDGSGLASGIYLYRIQAGRWSAVGKMALIK